MKARLQLVKLDPAKLKALNGNQRYTFALAGHIFNELMLAQKLLHSSRRPPGSIQPLLDGSMGSSMFVLRILIGKTHEAVTVLREPRAQGILVTDYFRPVSGLEARWNDACQHFDRLPWLRLVRNRGAFHYLEPKQWIPYLTDDICEDATLWTGLRHGDTYFHWSEVAATIPALSIVNKSDPIQGLDDMLREIGELLEKLGECLAHGLTSYWKRSLGGSDNSPHVEFDAPDLESFELPYFFGDPRYE